MGFGCSHQMGSDKSTGKHYLQLEHLGPEDICSAISRFNVYFFAQVSIKIPCAAFSPPNHSSFVKHWR